MIELLGYPSFVANPGFGNSEVAGLRMYEKGEVKEGVGAGGAMFAASMLDFSQKEFKEKTEEVYRSVFSIS
jgi:NaMN:DMB phosphoribosyltransferase